MISAGMAFFVMALGLGLYGIYDLIFRIAFFSHIFNDTKHTCDGVRICDSLTIINDTLHGLEFNVLPGDLELSAAYGGDAYQTTEGLRLRTPPHSILPRSPGTYNGLGIGGSAWAGVRTGCGRPLAEFESLAVVGSASREDPIGDVSFLLFVDTDGNLASDCVLVADPTTLPSLSLAASPAAAVAGAGDAVWKSLGGKCGMPPAAGGVGAPLSQVTGYNTTAGVACSPSTETGVLRETQLAGFQVVLGGAAQTDSAEVTIHHVAVWWDDLAAHYAMDTTF